jgi:hypothetical protein
LLLFLETLSYLFHCCASLEQAFREEPFGNYK